MYIHPDVDSTYLDHCMSRVRLALNDSELANSMLLPLAGKPPVRFIDHFRNEAVEELLELAAESNQRN